MEPFVEVQRTVNFHPEADAEFASAVDWYEKRRPGLGREFFAAVQRTIAGIAARPLLGVKSRIPGGGGERRVFVPRFPYEIVYLYAGQGVVVVAVAHQRRCPGFWKDRS